jgi:hypothetical protein
VSYIRKLFFMAKTRKNRSPTRGWSKVAPGRHERTLMRKRCGKRKKCFLGKNGSFPVCAKKTCRVSKKGLYSAYARARQFSSKGLSYKKIAKTAKRMLKKYFGV